MEFYLEKTNIQEYDFFQNIFFIKRDPFTLS
jgi:hypothetical protein